MKTYIALLRGINVGGNGRLPMANLRQLLADLGASDVQTYIQSGNAVFRHGSGAKGLSLRIADAIQAAHGFRPATQLLTLAELRALADANPYPEAASEPKTLHLFVLASKPKSPDLPALTHLAAKDERFHLGPRALYLHAPSGLARSKLATKAETLLGVPTTARNWRTVEKLLELAGET